VALGHGLWRPKWHLGSIFGAQIANGAEFVVPKLAPGMQFLHECRVLFIFFFFFFFDGSRAGGGLWPPLKYACRPFDHLLCLSIRLLPGFTVRGHVIQPYHFSSSFSSCRIQLSVHLF